MLVADSVLAIKAAPAWGPRRFSVEGKRLVTGLVRRAKLVQRRAMPVIAKATKALIRKQAHAVAARVRSGKASVVFDFPAYGDLWSKAIESVMAEMAGQAQLALEPLIDDVVRTGFEVTGTMMGVDVKVLTSGAVGEAARGIAGRIVGINGTTRRMFHDAVQEALAEDMTVPETAELLRTKFPGFDETRIRAIARTETANAFNQGSVRALEQSGAVTHVSVIGCESREYERWGSPSFQQFMYRGEGTCNIRDVPIGDAAGLNFHPNHTGVIVPSRIIGSDGEPEQIDLGQDET